MDNDKQIDETVDDDANLLIEEHLKITDPETEEVLYTGRS